MNLETLLDAVDKLSPEDREQVKNHLAQQEQVRHESAKAKIAALEDAIDDFWGDSGEEEMQPIFDAMRAK